MKLLIVGLVTALLSGCSSPYKNVPMAAPRSYTEGEEALLRGEYADAERHLDAYLETGRTTYRARAFYQLARARYQREDYSGAMEALEQLEGEFPRAIGKQTVALRGDVAYALGDRVEGVLHWESAYSQSTVAEREVLTPRISAAMQSLTGDEADELARRLTVPELYELAVDRLVSAPTAVYHSPDAAAAVATVAAASKMAAEPIIPMPGTPEVEAVEDEVIDEVEAGITVPANDGLAMVAEAPDGETAARAHSVARPAASETIREEVAAVADDPAAETAVGEAAIAETVIAAVGETAPSVDESHASPRIGCIVPLTGASRDDGRRALAILRQAFNDGTLLIRDSGSNSGVARGLIRELAANPEVIAVLGPMRADTVAAARSEAAKQGLPILPLISTAASGSERSKVTDAALASYAVNALGARRIGIISSGAGEPAFAETVSSLGATVVGTHQLGAGEPDLASVAEVTQSWIDVGGVDAIYIAAPASRAVAIAGSARAVAPQLILLGNQEWNDSAALTAAGATIEGAVITGRNAPSGSESVETQIRSAARALQRAIALGETTRAQTEKLLAGTSTGAAGPTLLRVSGGQTSAVRP